MRRYVINEHWEFPILDSKKRQLFADHLGGNDARRIYRSIHWLGWTVQLNKYVIRLIDSRKKSQKHRVSRCFRSSCTSSHHIASRVHGSAHTAVRTLGSAEEVIISMTRSQSRWPLATSTTSCRLSSLETRFLCCFLRENDVLLQNCRHHGDGINCGDGYHGFRKLPCDFQYLECRLSSLETRFLCSIITVMPSYRSTFSPPMQYLEKSDHLVDILVCTIRQNLEEFRQIGCHFFQSTHCESMDWGTAEEQFEFTEAMLEMSRIEWERSDIVPVSELYLWCLWFKSFPLEIELIPCT